MGGNVKKFDRQTRKKYEKRAQKRKFKNKRHPIEQVIEWSALCLLVVFIISVLVHICSKENRNDDVETTQENMTEYQSNTMENTSASIEDSTTDVKESSSESISETEEETSETVEDVIIKPTDSVWDDPFETVDSEINNAEKTYMEEIVEEWSADRYFFNLVIGSLETVFEQAGITQLTEEMNKEQQRYLMSNVIMKPENVIVNGTFMEKYVAYDNLISTVKENLKSGISFSRRYVALDYIGYNAPLQNALGLVPSNYEEMADNLKHLGITLNIISKSEEPKEDWVEYVEQLHRYGIAAGVELPYDGMEYDTWEEFKKVYQPVFDAGLDYIMLSDKVFPFITGNEPATFSKRFIQKLRNEMGFEGVIVTSDMSSTKIQEYIAKNEIQEPLAYAFMQGCDVMYEAKSFGSIYGRLNLVYSQGEISDARLKQSVNRVLNVAYLYNDLYESPEETEDNEENENDE